MKKEYNFIGALICKFSSYILKIVWWLPMFDFGIFCHVLRLMGIYRVRAPVRVFEKLCFLFSFLFFFLFVFHSSFYFCLSLFRGPFSSGAPGHCPPMPPSRYATALCYISFSIVVGYITLYVIWFCNVQVTQINIIIIIIIIIIIMHKDMSVTI